MSLTHEQLRACVFDLAESLDTLQIDYAVMGGAAVCLLAPSHKRTTKDVDLVIHVDHRSITADALTTQLLLQFPIKFDRVTVYEHRIPSYKLEVGRNQTRLVHLEVFDHCSSGAVK